MSEHIFIIAEVGINANGDINLAKKLIDMAIACGCDAVKFQKKTVDEVYSQELLDSPHESPWGTTHRAEKEGREFGQEGFDAINEYCKGKIPWFASAFDVRSYEFLGQYNFPYNKIPSRTIANEDLLRKVAEEGKFTFISTGIGNLRYIDTAVGIFREVKCPFMLMYCVAKYPCPDEGCALNSIMWLKGLYGCSVGYSCHNPSILAPSIAVAFGAEAVEVHITLDRASYGKDQAASFEKKGLEYIVRDCNRVGALL